MQRQADGLAGGHRATPDDDDDIDDAPTTDTAKVAGYFDSLGFGVDWDYDSRTGLHWHEIFSGGSSIKLLIQIDYSAPLDDLKSDLPLLAEGKPSTCASNWQVRGSIENIRLVVARMAQS